MEERKILFLIVLALAVILVATNVWWAFRLLGTSAATTVLARDIGAEREALEQALDVVEELGRDHPRDSLLDAVQTALGGERVSGGTCSWVGRLGFRFDAEGVLAEVVHRRQIEAGHPCHPAPDHGP